VRVKVGQHVTISLPGSSSVLWSAPTISASVPANAGLLRVLHSTQDQKTGGTVTSYTALRPGTAVLTARGRCTGAGNENAAIQCADGYSTWTGVVQVSR
jgi:hypothetical protein